MEKEYAEHIKELIHEGHVEKALELLKAQLKETPGSDEAWYLLGNAYRKIDDTRQAMNSYLQAMELNPDSPAHQAYNMLLDIMNFFNKDMYNH